MHTAVVANELAARGHQVVLFAKEGSHSRARVRTILDANYRYGLMPDASGRDQSEATAETATAAAVRMIEAGRFDAVLNNSPQCRPVHGVAGRGHAHRAAYPGRSDQGEHGDRVTGLATRLSACVRRRSAFTARDWRAKLPTVACIPNGIDLRRWRPARTAQPEPDLAVWAARITPEKGLPLAIRACRLAGLRLEIAGPIAHRDHSSPTSRPCWARPPAMLVTDPRRAARLSPPRPGLHLLPALARAVRSRPGRSHGLRMPAVVCPAAQRPR